MAGELETALRPIPPEVQGRSFWQNIWPILAFLPILTSCWTWITYFKKIEKIGFRPWRVRWSVITLFLAIFWSGPILFSALDAGLARAFDWLGKLIWALLTGDIGRLLKILRGKDPEIFQENLRDEALRMIFRRKGEIDYLLLGLQARAAVELSDALRHQIAKLEQEQDLLDKQIDLFQESRPVSSETPIESDALEHRARQFSAQYHALQELAPELPDLMEPKT